MDAGAAPAMPGIGMTPRTSLAPAVAETQSHQARRTQLVGQLAGGIVHDFNNIFTAFIGTLGVLAEAVADQPELAAIARLAEEAAARGIGLASDLLVFARGEPSPPRDVAVDTLLADAVRLLRPVMGRRIEIDVSPATVATHAIADGNQIMTAIFYLSLNARDAMPEGGKLIFATRRDVPAECLARADGKAAAGQLVITIDPLGAGTSACDPAEIFIDLGAAQDCITPSGGRVEICGGSGCGMSIRIYLPG